jgi:tetratricopeptide (TPR) repeat protein
MRALIRDDPGLAMVALALVLVVALYAPVLGYGLTNYDDPWLIAHNTTLRDPSLSSLHAVFCDLDISQRLALGAEYLPVRDLSVMLDFAVWGEHYGGAHATNLLLYMAAIAIWFAALAELGIDRRVAGIAVLLWALHPAHVESVAWLAERKGVLGMWLAGTAVLGHARFRAGRAPAWLAVAAVAAVAAVWSKAPAAFAVAALAAFEVALPARRVSLLRSAVGVAVIAAVALAAYVPVVITATKMGVVGDAPPLVAGRVASVLGFHGFYIELAAMARANAPTYAIVHAGPGAVELALGAIALVGCAVALARGSGPLRAGVALWLLGWFPVSELVLPVQTVALADRYLLTSTLGAALVAAIGIARIPRPASRRALLAVLCVAACARTLDAVQTWASPRALWQRAVDADPADTHAWSELANAYAEAGDLDTALAVTEQGLANAPGGALWLRDGLLELARGDRETGVARVRVAAELGNAIAMADLAALIPPAEGLAWARRAAVAAPGSAHAHRTLGRLALAGGFVDEAIAASARAVELDPGDAANHYQWALALLAAGRDTDARRELDAASRDPAFAQRAADQLGRLPGKP